MITQTVLIIGAGPVGLTLAVELTRFGIPVRIVDQALHRTDKSKAIVIWSRTLELLGNSGLTESFLAAGHRANAANIIAGDKVLAHLDFSTVASPYPFALMLPQAETERLLEEHLAQLGVKVERGVTALRFIQSKTAVETTLALPSGQEETARTDWLVGCDGAHSVVRHGLDVEFHGETDLTDWVLADLHLQGLKISPTEIAIFWHEDGPLALFPLGETRYRIIADVGRSNHPHPPQPTLEQMQKLANERGLRGVILSNPIWLSGFKINERKVKDYRYGHVFLAGDAAHIHSPAGGQGMNTGMQDAFNLAWKLARAARGFAGAEKLLDSYSVERSAIGDQVLANASRLTALTVVQNHAVQAIRNLFAPVIFGLHPVKRTMANTLTEVSIGYKNSPLNGPAGPSHLPAPGERVATIKREQAFGVGAFPRFVLCAARGPAIDKLVNEYSDLLDPELRAPRGDGVLLVRPDGYAACSSGGDELTPIANYLHQLRE